MTLEEIKTRQMTNQHLVTHADKLTVIRDLCGIQAQFLSNAMHSLKIRCENYDESSFQNGLVKNWTVRGTVHVFAEEDLPLFIHCRNGEDYRRKEWNGYTYPDQQDQWTLTPKRQEYFSEVILTSLKEGPHTREELKALCRERGMTSLEEASLFDQWGGGIRDLCERGFIHYVVQEKKAFCLSPAFTPIPEEEANLEIARRYFTNIAPATIHDAMYYFHATAAQVKNWLARLPVTSTECGGKTYYYIENGKSYTREIPKCVFLAGFDQLMLGYEKKESLYLEPENRRRIFNLAGIVSPSILWNGQVIGKWRKKNRTLSLEFFSPVRPTDLALIKGTAEALWNDLSKIAVME